MTWRMNGIRRRLLLIARHGGIAQQVKQHDCSIIMIMRIAVLGAPFSPLLSGVRLASINQPVAGWLDPIDRAWIETSLSLRLTGSLISTW